MAGTALGSDNEKVGSNNCPALLFERLRQMGEGHGGTIRFGYGAIAPVWFSDKNVSPRRRDDYY
jgi:hypothetical protein